MSVERRAASDTPWPNTASVAMVNGALESFARAPTPAPTAAQVAQIYLSIVDAEATGTTHFVDGFGPS